MSENRTPENHARVNTRQRKFIQGKLEGKSNAQAARDAGYSESVANVAGRKILSHPAVRAKMGELLERDGLSDKSLDNAAAAKKLLAQLEALGSDRRDFVTQIIQSFNKNDVLQLRFCAMGLQAFCDRAANKPATT